MSAVETLDWAEALCVFLFLRFFTEGYGILLLLLTEYRIIDLHNIRKQKIPSQPSRSTINAYENEHHESINYE